MVCDAMRNHLDDEGVQRWALGVFLNLALCCDCREDIGEHHGLDLTHSAMDSYPNDRDMQRWGCRAFRNLTYQSRSNRLTANRLDSAFLLRQAMVSFPDDLDLQRSGCGALLNLSFNEDIRKRIGVIGGAAIVSNAMHTNQSDPELVRCACAALVMLKTLGGSQLRKMADMGCDDCVNKALLLHRDDPDVQRAGQQALSNPGTSDMNYEVMLDIPATCVEAIFFWEGDDIEKLHVSSARDTTSKLEPEENSKHTGRIQQPDRSLMLLKRKSTMEALIATASVDTTNFKKLREPTLVSKGTFSA